MIKKFYLDGKEIASKNIDVDLRPEHRIILNNELYIVKSVMYNLDECCVEVTIWKPVCQC